MKFFLKPVVYCPKCYRALVYMVDRDELRFLYHDGVDCPISGKKFKAPEIELEPVNG